MQSYMARGKLLKHRNPSAFDRCIASLFSVIPIIRSMEDIGVLAHFTGGVNLGLDTLLSSHLSPVVPRFEILLFAVV